MAKKKKEHFCLTKWRKRVASAEKRGYFTNYDNKLAGNWKLCAVGESHKSFPLVAKYMRNPAYDESDNNPEHQLPVDRRLGLLGGNFSDLVCTRGEWETDYGNKKISFKPVYKALDAIEKRLEQLYVLL